MSELDRIVSVLEQAKVKLVEAQRHMLAAASECGRITNGVSHTLGRAGQGSPVMSLLSSTERAFAQQGAAITALSGSVDAAIAQAKSAGTAGRAAGGG